MTIHVITSDTNPTMVSTMPSVLSHSSVGNSEGLGGVRNQHKKPKTTITSGLAPTTKDNTATLNTTHPVAFSGLPG